MITEERLKWKENAKEQLYINEILDLCLPDGYDWNFRKGFPRVNKIILGIFKKEIAWMHRTDKHIHIYFKFKKDLRDDLRNCLEQSKTKFIVHIENVQ